MSGILGSSHRSLSPELSPTWGDPPLLSLHPDSTRAGSISVAYKRSFPGVKEWGHGHKVGTKGEMENLEKVNCQKTKNKKAKNPTNTQRSKAAPCFIGAGLFFLAGEQWAESVVLVLESNKHIWELVTLVGVGWGGVRGCSLLCWVHSETFLHDIQEMLLRKEGPPFRKFLPGGMGWLGTPNPRVSPQPSRCRPLPADYGSVPAWLSSCLWKSSLGLEKGRAWADSEQMWEGSVWRMHFASEAGSVWFSLKHGTSSIMVFKMSFALYKFMEKDRMLKSLKANFVLNTKVLLWKKLIPTKCLAVKRLTYN